MRMAGLPVKKRGGDRETAIEGRRSSDGGRCPWEKMGDFLKPHRQRLKFPAVKSATRDLTRLQDMGLDA
jgi:hypothetical protein